MSDTAISKDCLHHYDNRHIQVRWDFYCLCAYDKSKFNQKLTKNGKKVKDEPNQECMAKIIRILETLTNHEKADWALRARKLKDQGLNPPPEPKEFPLELSYGAICSLLYDSYGESTVRNSVAYLIQLGFIKQYQQTKNSIPLYVLEIQALQKALKDQAEAGVEIDSQSQVSKSTARRPNSTARRPNSTAGGVEFDNNNNSKNNETQKNESTSGTNDSTQSNSLTPSSTLSLSVEQMSTSYPHVDKQADGDNNLRLKQKLSEQADGEPHLPIATVTTGNASATVNARNTEPLLSAEDRIDGYWQELGFISNPTAKEHWNTLSKHITSFEQMKALYEYARLQLVDAKDPTVHPGNLVKAVNGWKQKQAPVKQPDKKQSTIVDPLVKYKAIGAQFIGQGVN